MFICDNNSNDPDIHFPTIKPFLLITFFPLIVASKNRFSMITKYPQLKLKARLPRCKLQLAGSQQTHIQPCADVQACQCAGVNCAGMQLQLTCAWYD